MIKMLQGLIILPYVRPPFFVFFRDLNDFHIHKASAGKKHLPNLIPFTLFLSTEYSLTLFRAQIKAIKMLQGSIHPANTPYFAFFRGLSEFYVRRGSAGKAHSLRA